ncbi:nucleoside deaminase [Mariniblastus sp.]|nr:nucleoside deaminase [Mariniblastus sp.]
MMSFEVSLPQWAVEENQLLPECIPDVEQRMREVIRFAELNFDKKTGGPFAAGIFEKNSGKVVGIGVNRVVPANNSSAHAEIVAISLAQTKLATFDLGGPGMPDFQIVVNGRPCAMCCGALPWSGVRSLVIGASGERIESLTGFDEGAVHPNWQRELEARGIEVIENVLAKGAEVVFQRFRDSDEPVYNGRSGDELK